MISRLRGQLEEKNAGNLVLMANGVGYEVFIPLSTFYDLPGPGTQVSLYIKTVVREDAIELFGFLTQAEKEAFLLLTGVTKVGPRLALNILSGIGPGELVTAITTRNMARLTSIPGIGTKTAERLLMELKDKAAKLTALVGVQTAGLPDLPINGLGGDVVSALMNLGYARQEAEKAVAAVMKHAESQEADLGDLIRLSLKRLKKD
ncbi:MAG: Holliday junction branch migration protein RuvA [Deltaproteobacteria bacterium]|nr:Holliday junction branch migration protein RuvA [Deltaproteobacteria bacterium]